MKTGLLFPFFSLLFLFPGCRDNEASREHDQRDQSAAKGELLPEETLDEKFHRLAKVDSSIHLERITKAIADFSFSKNEIITLIESHEHYFGLTDTRTPLPAHHPLEQAIFFLASHDPKSAVETYFLTFYGLPKQQWTEENPTDPFPDRDLLLRDPLFDSLLNGLAQAEEAAGTHWHQKLNQAFSLE